MKGASGRTFLPACSFLLHLTPKLKVQDICIDGNGTMSKSQAMLKGQYATKSTLSQKSSFWLLECQNMDFQQPIASFPDTEKSM